MPVTIECDECGKKLERVKVQGPDNGKTILVLSWACGAVGQVPDGGGVHNSPSTVMYCSNACRDKMRARERLDRARRDLETAEAEMSRVSKAKGFLGDESSESAVRRMRDGTPGVAKYTADTSPAETDGGST